MENLSTFVRTLGNQFIRGKKVFVGAIGLDGKVLDGGNSSGTSGQVLSTTGSNVQWITVGSSNVEGINDLNDVTITSLTSGDLLKYNGSEWVNFTAELSDLNDVGNLSPSNNDILVYNSVSGLWVADSYPTFTEVDTLDTVTGRTNGNTTTNSISVSALTATGNVTAASVITPLVSYNGTITVKSIEQINQGDSNPVIFNVNWINSTQFSVDGDGYATASTGFKVSGSSGFLKADGTIDTNTYLTSYTESQDLDDVTDLGASTTNTITVGGVVSSEYSSTTTIDIIADTPGNIQPDPGIPVELISFIWDTTDLGHIDTDGKITFNGFKTPSGTSAGFLKADGSVDTTAYLSSAPQRDLDSLSDVSISNPQADDLIVYDNASGEWVNSSLSFATTSYVDTAVSNLVGAAPSALDTLNELAAALGDDANFSTTITNSIATKLPLAGGTLTGNLLLNDGARAGFGDDSDLRIYHDATNSYITNATGEIFIKGADDLSIQDTDGTNRAIFQANAQKLYYDGSLKFETTSTGVSVTGDIIATDSNTPMLKLLDTTNNLQGRFRVANNYAYLSVDNPDNVASSRLVFEVDGSTPLYLDHQSNATFSGDVTISSASAPVLRFTNTTGSQSWIQYVGSNDDFIIRDETDARSPLIINGSGNSTFSGDVTANGVYTAGNSAPIFWAQRSGGAVAGDWSYDDATTDMSLGTSTSHSFSLKTGNTRALTIDTSQNATFAGSVTTAGAVTIANTSVSQTSPTTQLLFDHNNIDNGGGYNIDFKSSSNDTANRFMARIQALRGSGAISSLGFFTETGSALNRALLLDSSQNATFSGDARLNSRVRIGDVTGLSNRGTVRIDTRGDAPADLLFGRDTAGTATSWSGVYWSLSSRSSSDSNAFRIYRGTSHSSPYNSEAVLLQLNPDLSATFAGTIQSDDITIVDGTNDVNLYLANTSYGIQLDYSAGDIFFRTNNATRLTIANGGNATFAGSVNIGDGSADTRLVIKRVDGNNADDIQFYNGTTRVGEIGTKDTTWLRINQTTAKNIYTPRYIRADGGFFVDSIAKGINGSGNFIGGTITGASDANVSNWDTAYGWGDHASAGYLTSVTASQVGNVVGKGQNNNYIASSTSTSNRGNYGKGVWAYSGYSSGSNRPFTYDATLQVMPTSGLGFELSTSWHSTDEGKLKIRALRDCCEGWGSYYDVWTSANFSPSDFVSTSGDTMTGALTIQDSATGILIDSPGHASLRLDRASTSYDNNILFQTAGDIKFRIWQDGNADYLYIRDDDNGANMVTFKKGGNVGIGVGNPDNALDIDSSYTNSVHIQGTGSHNLYSYHDSAGVGWATGSGTSFTNLVYMDSSNNIRTYTNGTEKMRIDSAGKVKINTTVSTLGKLSVRSQSGANTFYNNIQCVPSDATTGGLFLGSNVANDAIIVTGAYYANAGNYTPTATSASSINMFSGNIVFRANDSLTVGTNYVPTERMRIDGSTGNAIFANVIQVAGGTVQGVNDNHNAGVYLSTANRGLSGNFSGYARNLISSIGSGVIEIGQNTSLINNIRLRAGSSSTNGVITFLTKGSERMRIDSGGQVGIGTSTPDTHGYEFAEDLVIYAGASASDGAGLTINSVSRRYGVIAFGDTADTNAGEIFYDHTVNSMNFRVGGSHKFLINSSGIDVLSGNIAIDGNKGFNNSGGWTRNTTPYGYIELGPANTSWAHIYTDRPNFYFNKNLYVNNYRVWTADDFSISSYLPLAGGTLTGTLSGPVFSGNVTSSGDGQSNYPFRLGADYNSYMMTVASNTWGLFWAGNSGARYGTNGSGGPGNIWSNSTNPNEFAFVGSDSTAWTVHGSTGNTWQKGDLYVGGGDIILSGTGRIQGIDTVSASTDAASKAYVDAHPGTTQTTVSGNSGGVSITGYGTSNFTFYQSSSSFAGYTGGWANYYIGNHGNGSNYYNTTIIFPFWSSPKYSRLESNNLSSVYDFWTSENFTPSNYLGLAGGTMTGNLSMNASIDFGSSNGYVNLSKGSFVTFYENGNAHHGIGSRNNSGGEADDIRINSYGAVYVNLDSNNNNTSGADFSVGRHGGGTGTISDLGFRVSGETGNVGVGTINTDRKLSVESTDSVVARFTNPSNQMLIDLQCDTDAGSNGFRFVENGAFKMAMTYLPNKDGIQFGTNWVSGDDKLFIKENGRVGIATDNPSYPLHVNSSVSNVSIYASADITAFSDARVKDNIMTISNPLDKIKAIRGVTYERTDLESDKRSMGVIAQEVLPHVPEVVHEDEKGMYSVSYQNMVALLIEGMKEQQKEIDELKSMLKK